MFLSEWREFPSAPCFAGKQTWWQLASPCCWNRARPWHAFELVSFLVWLSTYQHPGTRTIRDLILGRVNFFFCVFYPNLPDRLSDPDFLLFKDKRDLFQGKGGRSVTLISNLLQCQCKGDYTSTSGRTLNFTAWVGTFLFISVAWKDLWVILGTRTFPLVTTVTNGCGTYPLSYTAQKLNVGKGVHFRADSTVCDMHVATIN